MNRPPGVVLYDAHPRRSGSVPTIDGSSTPLDSIASPAMYYQDAYSFPMKMRQASKSNAGTPTRFLRHPDEDDTAYPDYDDESRLSFLRKPTTQILLSVVLGTALGAVLANFEVSTDVSDLVNLPGRIFLRVLKCFVIPMVFASLSTGVANIVLLGKVSSIGTRTALYFVLFSAIAAMLSLCIAMMLRNLHTDVVLEPKTKQVAWFNVFCDNGKYLEMTPIEALDCSAPEMGNTTLFQLADLESALTYSGTTPKISVEEQLAGILNSLFPNNIFTSFVDGALLSVITFSIAFGAAATRATSRENSPLLDVLNQMSKIFYFIITRVINWSPLAVFSLIAGSLSSQKTIKDSVTHVGVLVLCNLLTVILLELVFYPIVLFFSIRKNPFKYMRAMAPAATFAFGSASSLATLPVTIRCVESTREVSRGLLQFVTTIGSTVHMNGTAMFFPNAVIFLVKTSTSEIELGWVQLFLIWLVSLLGSLGVAPIPNAGLVMVYSIWSTIFPSEDLPITYSYLVAIHWYIDRMNTLCNVIGDTYVARIIAEQVDEAYETTLEQQRPRGHRNDDDDDDDDLHHLQ